jgi:hypothetical protein
MRLFSGKLRSFNVFKIGRNIAMNRCTNVPARYKGFYGYNVECTCESGMPLILVPVIVSFVILYKKYV